MASERNAGRGEPSPLVRASIGFVFLAVVLAIFGDFEISTLDPWTEFNRMLKGVVTPDFLATQHLAEVLLMTVVFAFLGAALGIFAGFAQGSGSRPGRRWFSFRSSAPTLDRRSGTPSHRR